MKMIHPGNLRAVTLCLALLLALVTAPRAFAHARLLKSSPEKGAQLAVSPDHVELWFNELLEEGFNTLEVYPTAELTANQHSNLAEGQPKVDPADPTHLSVKLLQALKPGEYVLEWRVLSRDGHSAPGRILFTVLPPK
jgi:methionine-rich copper-binding protein CopC